MPGHRPMPALLLMPSAGTGGAGARSAPSGVGCPGRAAGTSPRPPSLFVRGRLLAHEPAPLLVGLAGGLGLHRVHRRELVAPLPRPRGVDDRPRVREVVARALLGRDARVEWRRPG